MNTCNTGDKITTRTRKRQEADERESLPEEERQMEMMREETARERMGDSKNEWKR